MKRIVTALLVTVLLFLALFLDPFYWLMFVCIFALGTGIEFTNVLYKGKLMTLRFLVIVACLVFPVNAFLQINGLPSLPDMLIVASLFVLAPILFILNKGAVDDFHTSVPMVVYGALWIGLLLSFYVHLRYLKLGGYEYGVQAIFFFLLVVAVSDVSAYYVGKGIGRHKLSKLYSPNKTWEGSIGGFIGGILIAYLCYFLWAQEFTLLHTGIIAVIIVAFGQLGDLAESLFKRSCKVKDAGDVLPGHGGMLDRIDSMLIAIPAFYWYIYFVLGG